MSTSEHLNLHKPAIVVTNFCNRNCGGCLQLCGHFPNTFHISEKQFRRAIEVSIVWAKTAWEKMPQNSRFFVIYGGEPTLHPRWNNLVKIMFEYPDYPFIVYTNGHFLARGTQHMGLIEENGGSIKKMPLIPIQVMASVAQRPVIKTNENQTEFEFFSELISKEGYSCEGCRNTFYQCVGLGENAAPSPWQGYITVYVRCTQCRALYQFDTEQDTIGFARIKPPAKTTVSLRKRLQLVENLPHSALEKHQQLFSDMATFYTDNVAYRLDYKHKYSVLNYNPILAAPCDYLPDTDFWEMAQRKCFLWQNCESAIYNGKAYFCSVAAAMDYILYNGENGWAVNESFLTKTDDEIRIQADKFCHRCGYCFGARVHAEQTIGMKQFSHTKTLASKTNYTDFPKKDKIQLIRELKWNL